MNLILLLIIFSFILAASELLKLIFKLSSEVTRRLSHASAAVIASFLPIQTDLRTTLFLGLVFTVLMIVSKRNKLLSSIHDVKRESIGAVLFPIGIAVSALLFWETPKIFQIACLVLGLSDSLAGFAGSMFGKWKYNFTGLKTVEGYLIFGITTFFILLISGNNPKIISVVIVSCVLMLTEGLSGGGWDNLTVPVITGFLLKTFL